MFGAVGAPVVRLVRVRIGPLRLDLAAGAARPLTAAEVRRLGASTYHPGVTPGAREEDE
jgi:16S rRNA U516 pseudouridylate synthase RsuA-like enzyme